MSDTGESYVAPPTSQAPMYTKEQLDAAVVEARIDELEDLWTSGKSLHADIRCDYNRGLTVHDRIAELKETLPKKEDK